MIDSEIVKVYLRISRDQCLNTFDWLRDLFDMGALDRENLREWQDDYVRANDALRKRLIKKYKLKIEPSDSQVKETE